MAQTAGNWKRFGAVYRPSRRCTVTNDDDEKPPTSGGARKRRGRPVHGASRVPDSRRLLGKIKEPPTCGSARLSLFSPPPSTILPRRWPRVEGTDTGTGLTRNLVLGTYIPTSAYQYVMSGESVLAGKKRSWWLSARAAFGYSGDHLDLLDVAGECMRKVNVNAVG